MQWTNSRTTDRPAGGAWHVASTSGPTQSARKFTFLNTQAQTQTCTEELKLAHSNQSTIIKRMH